jgi:hypothetical protein
MKKIHAIFDFVSLAFPEKITFGRNVHTMMTGNVNYPTPDVPLADIKAKTDLLEEQMVAASHGGPPETALLHQTAKEWDDMMRDEARYVDRIAKGNEAMIRGAGFNVSQQPNPYVRPEFSAKIGEQPGTARLRRQAVQGAKSYIWQLSKNVLPVGEDGWSNAKVTTKATALIDGLDTLTIYWFRVAAVTPAGTLAYNAPIMLKMV